uniref:Uncharacterized protein n=1 Tax=Lepeophtheirus salmonis TaxID=72036 RepID=A0A0K2UI52_LEPSM
MEYPTFMDNTVLSAQDLYDKLSSEIIALGVLVA